MVLESVPLPLGGERWYALCPKRGARCAVLILPPGATQFASAKGWHIPYSSQRDCEVQCAHRAIDKAQGRLKRMSNYARRPSRDRLWATIAAAKHQAIDDGMERLAALMRRG